MKSLTQFCLTLLICTASVLAAAEGPTEHLEPMLHVESCERAGFDRPLRCGTLTVLENREDPEGRTIDLQLVVLPAKDGGRRSDAVLYLVGGPGGAATDSLAFLSNSLSSLQETRDVILVDQRGTGQSNRLECSLSLHETLDAIFTGRIPSSTLETCLTNLDADPAFYTTPATADDLDAVRSALGYEQVDLVGMSYGSRLALVYLRRYPERVRTLALRGAASPAGNILVDVGRASEEAMTDLLARCAKDPKCVGRFPDLRAKLDRILGRLAQQAAEIEVERSDGGKTRLKITRHLAAGILRYALYSDRSAAWIPMLIETADRGKWDMWARLLGGGFGPDATAASIGLYLSVLCAEDVSFLDVEVANGNLGLVFLDPSMIDNFAEACRVWPHATLPAGYKTPVRSEVPALLMSGSDDPATPLGAAEEIGGWLGNSRHLVTPGLAHHPTWTSCFARNTALLIESGSHDALDLDCADDFVRAEIRRPRPWGEMGIALLALAAVAFALFQLRRHRRRTRSTP